ncbi:MAG: FAD:protein FMN transferase [Acidobacteriota bacterium]|nr:FAD:protein FMN transferase [Acidobacteriota bacterium]MDH3786224.1 FAD:protein FMN transferase [Acidobacteriota bacterium]
MNKALLSVLVLFFAAGCGGRNEDGRQLVSAQRMLMGTSFRIEVVTTDSEGGRAAAEAALDEVARVEERLSEWKTTSEISAVNRAAGESVAVEVGEELYEVVERALQISEMTDGAFDITYAACGHLWSFREPRIPTDAQLAACLPSVGSERVELTAANRAIRLPDPAMKIGISGIGKGYGVDRAAAVLESHGIFDYTIDGGGDLRVRGGNVDRPWQVGLADPRREGSLSGAIELDRGAIVTSGDYHLFFERDGTRYHHILDPRTGRPAPDSIAVTVIARNAMDADALATGLFVLGPLQALERVEALAGVEALITDPEGVRHASSGFPISGHSGSTIRVDAASHGK